MTDLSTCPSCTKEVSDRAFDCPHCGHPIRKPKRGFFGILFKWALILFNVFMIIWMIGYIGVLSEKPEGAESEAYKAGATLGGAIGIGMLLVLWVIGDIILGLATILTRPRK